jgi:hypothetical protein
MPDGALEAGKNAAKRPKQAFRPFDGPTTLDATQLLHDQSAPISDVAARHLKVRVCFHG